MTGPEGQPAGPPAGRSGAPEGLSDAQRTGGMRLACAGQSLGMILQQMLFLGALGPLFIKRLGGSDFQAMMCPTLFGVLALLQLPTSVLVPPAQGKRVMLWCWGAMGFFTILAVALAALLGPGQPAVWAVIAALGVGLIFHSCGGTFWFPLLYQVVPPERRGRFFGKMRALWGAVVFAAVLAAGAFLGRDPPLWRFYVVIGLAVAAFLGRNFFVARIPLARAVVAADRNYHDWKRHLRAMLARGEVMIFCLYYTLLGFGGGFLALPVVLYMNHKGWAVRDNVIIYSFASLGMVIALAGSGHLVDRLGTKRVFLGTHVLLCVVCFGMVGIGAMPTGPARLLMPTALVLLGAARAVAALACTAQLFHLAPEQGRVLFMSLGRILLFAGPALSPPLAGKLAQLASPAWRWRTFAGPLDVFQVMFAAAGLGLVGLLWMLRLVRDVRAEPR